MPWKRLCKLTKLNISMEIQRWADMTLNCAMEKSLVYTCKLAKLKICVEMQRRNWPHWKLKCNVELSWKCLPRSLSCCVTAPVTDSITSFAMRVHVLQYSSHIARHCTMLRWQTLLPALQCACTFYSTVHQLAIHSMCITYQSLTRVSISNNLEKKWLLIFSLARENWIFISLSILDF